ncbi:cellulase 2 [Aphelenchoides avenae]|nr:cellulase 2 [Aphelenchus avenae]
MHDLLLVLSTLAALASGQTCTSSSSLTWSTSNGNILLNGQPFVLKGINWFGFETETFSPHGLWGGATTLKAVLDLLVNNGFNALRIPFSLEMIQSNPKTNINCGDNPDLCGKPALETLSVFIDKCAERGILVLLDYHRITSQGGITELW